MPRLPLGYAKFQFLVERKFPTLKARRAAALSFRETGLDEDETNSLLERAERYREELSKKPKAEIAALIAREKAAEKRETDERERREDEERFFNKPEAAADIGFWKKAAYWTIDEAVALSLGKQPQLVNWESLKPYLAGSPFAREFEARRMLANRARTTNQLAEPNLPGFFLAWAIRNDIDVPAELVAAVEARGHQVADWKTAYDNAQALIATLRDEIASLKDQQADTPPARKSDELGTRARDTAYSLIIAMAVGAYGYRPDDAKSRSISKIGRDLDKVSLPLHPETIRNWLKEARQLLSSGAFNTKTG